MEYNTEKQRVFELCPSSGILNYKTRRFGNLFSLRYQVSGERERERERQTPTLLCLLEGAKFNLLTFL
jgi:hypothetical protein